MEKWQIEELKKARELVDYYRSVALVKGKDVWFGHDKGVKASQASDILSRIIKNNEDQNVNKS